MVADTQLVPYQFQGVSTLGAEHGRLNDKQRNVIADTLGKDCPKEDLDLFFWTCEKYELNPFGVAQIWGVPRNERVQVGGQWQNKRRLITQVGVNGLVLIAQRTGLYQGMTAPLWADKDGRWHEFWNFVDKSGVPLPPEAAKIGVAIRGRAQPSYAIANWVESATFDRDGKPQNLWKTKPAMMLAKTAASLALRRTFQQEFADLRASFSPELGERPSRADAAALLYPSTEIEVLTAPATPREQPVARAARPERPIGNPDSAELRLWRAKFQRAAKDRNLGETTALPDALGLPQEPGAIDGWAQAHGGAAGYEALYELLEAGKTVADYAADNQAPDASEGMPAEEDTEGAWAAMQASEPEQRPYHDDARGRR